MFDNNPRDLRDEPSFSRSGYQAVAGVNPDELAQERLRDLGDTARSIVHDMNNSLMPILGFAELLLMHPKNLEDTERVRRYLLSIQSAAERASEVIVRLRSFYDGASPASGSTVGAGDHSTDERLPFRGMRILFADDEPLVVQLVSDYLRGVGHTVHVATNGREALDQFRVNRYDLDLVLIDRAMPDLTGDQVAEQVRRERPELPIVLLTGLADASGGVESLPNGIDLVLGKPITMDALREALATVSARSHAR